MSSGKEGLVLTAETLNTRFAEAYRSLRANIEFSSLEQKVKTILVTSASPKEGKSTTLLNLAIIMAQAGPRVLAVDADFRHPALHGLLGAGRNGIKPLPGLSNLLGGTATIAEVVLATGFPRLGVVPTGFVPLNPGELLGSRRMRALLQDLADQADYVLLDSPPCLQYADALVLSSMVDGVVYVARAGALDAIAQRRVQRQLQQAKARMLGVVFNGAESGQSAGPSVYEQNGHKAPDHN
jgi:protein-tyrosine kinase